MSKNKRLKIELIINVILLVVSAMALDSESIIPVIGCALSVSWLFLFTMANIRG